MARVLVVDDEIEICKSLESFLTLKGFEVDSAYSGKEGLEKFLKFDPDLVLLDLLLGDCHGIDVLKKMKKSNSDAQVIIVTAHGDVEEAIKAGELGACDFIKKPYELSEVLNRSQNALDSKSYKQRLDYFEIKEKKSFGEGKIIGESPKIKEVLETGEKICKSDLPTTVFITGETGTGKEMLARALHYMSPRSDKPFIECNCSAVPENLIESELFGHEKGAFTDAKQKRIGLVELANHGTLFLDEIGDMDLSLQAKMLKFIEEKNFRRLGSTNLIKVDTRIITATNKDLKKLIKEEKFRMDLYYRLNVVTLELPPLRERGDDVLVLADYFTKYYNKMFGKDFKGISEPVNDAFRRYVWPGNIRELKNLMERIILLEQGSEITFEHLPQEISSDVLMKDLLSEKDSKEQIYSLEELESVYIHRVLESCQNNKTKAAKLLGINRNTLDRKLNKQD